jgi:hypothetical protein
MVSSPLFYPIYIYYIAYSSDYEKNYIYKTYL